MAVPQHGYIELTVEASDDDFLNHWFTEPEVAHNGKIVFYNTDAGSAMRKTEFETGYCVEYHEEFNHAGSMPMIIDVAITAGKIKINGIEHKKPWA